MFIKTVQRYVYKNKFKKQKKQQGLLYTRRKSRSFCCKLYDVMQSNLTRLIKMSPTFILTCDKICFMFDCTAVMFITGPVKKKTKNCIFWSRTFYFPLSFTIANRMINNVIFIKQFVLPERYCNIFTFQFCAYKVISGFFVFCCKILLY